MSDPPPPVHHRLATPALGVIIVIGTVAILYFARGILIPVVFARSPVP